MKNEGKMSEAEVLQSAMIGKVKQSSDNIDLQPFFLRNVLGARLRAENPGKIPILLYWHPNVDKCASICKIKGVDAAGLAAKTSIISRIRNALGVGDARTLTNELAVAKLLVPKTETLQYIADSQYKILKKSAQQNIHELYQSNLEENWAERRKEIVEKLPSWDNDHDSQIVVAFYIPSGEQSNALHLYSKCDQLDAYHHGDDGLLRLFISFEFRRALRDRLMEQQRHFNFLNDCQLRQQRIAEQRRREEEEEKNKKEEAERQKELDDETWEYDQEDTSTMLQRAGGTFVNGVQATGGLVVGGASMVVGGASAIGGVAWTGVSMAGSVASGSAGTLASLFKR